jgi:hypothetical protein
MRRPVTLMPSMFTRVCWQKQATSALLNEASVLFTFSEVLPSLVGSSHRGGCQVHASKSEKVYSEGHIDGISVYSRWSKASLATLPFWFVNWTVVGINRIRRSFALWGLDFSMRAKAFIDELHTFIKLFRTEFQR